MRRVLVGVVALVLVAAGFLGWRWWQDSHRTDLDEALSLLPAHTLRASFTDWAGVRASLKSDVGPSSNGDDVRAFMDSAFEDDLTAASTIDESAVALQLKYGVSPATVDWEVFGQAKDGAVMVLRLPDNAAFGAISQSLSALGYQRPASDDGVWRGGADLLPTIDPTLTPELQYVALLADQHLLLSSDSDSYLSSALESAQGDAGHLSVGDLGTAVEDPLAGVVFARDYACEALAMSQADDESQAQAARLVSEAGGVSPLTGLVVAATSTRDVDVVMQFENDDQAAHDARARVELASGPAPSLSDDFPSLFRIRSATTSGHLAVLHLKAEPDTYLLSELTSGPVLFLTC